MKLSGAPLSKRQVVNSSSISALPRFLGPMNLQKASRFKYGALFTLEDLLGMWFNLAEGVLVLPSLELTCFREAPLAAGAQSHFFPHISNGPFEDDLAGYR